MARPSKKEIVNSFSKELLNFLKKKKKLGKVVSFIRNNYEEYPRNTYQSFSLFNRSQTVDFWLTRWICENGYSYDQARRASSKKTISELRILFNEFNSLSKK